MAERSTRSLARAAGALTLVACLAHPSAEAMDQVEIRASSVAIVAHEGDAVEQRLAELLRARILRRSRIDAKVTANRNAAAELRILLGRRAASSREFQGLVERHGLVLPHNAPEGYALKRIEEKGQPVLLAQGADARGLLYAVGEILRRLHYGPEAIGLGQVDVSTAPAYRFRGSSANQGGTMRQLTGARSWSPEEWQDYFLDFALAGANVGYAGGAQFDFLHEFDLMTVGGCRPNQFRAEFPPEWKASGLEAWEGTQWVCPSVPEARAALLEQWDERFSRMEDHEILRFYAGDPGGCRCSRCMPWGKTFVELCEEVAAIWRTHHPETVIQIANQDLSNEGDRAIFAYLNEAPRTWLHGIAYGPGSNALSTYFRDELREDLFVYPGTGPLNRYLVEILNNLPKHQTITHYSDITHWIRSQYNLEQPDPTLIKAYNRRTFHTRPVAYYRIFQAIMPFSNGDIIYSEGYHDEFHQYLWNRLLWDPNRRLDDILDEYCSQHFGRDAATDMTAALLQLEQNLEAPLAANPGIDRYYLLVQGAGWKIPPHLMNRNYRWMLHMQKAALDKYFQLKLRRELARDAALKSLAAAAPEDVVDRARKLIGEPLETRDMASLKEEARRLGDESDRVIGLRNVGYFSIDRPLTALSWTVAQFEKAAEAKTRDERDGVLRNLAHYEDAGAGGFYDDAGAVGRQPHLIRGSSYDASARMDPDNRPSQNTVAYSLEDPQGVAFRYTDLDRTASYRLRVTMVLPRMRPQTDAQRDSSGLQSVLADGEYLVRDVELPVYTARQFEYDVPTAATNDGVLELVFERGTGSMGVVVSEVWLLKR